jgi:hypothetical protein
MDCFWQSSFNTGSARGMTTKTCPTCKLDKPTDSFFRNKAKKDGFWV